MPTRQSQEPSHLTNLRHLCVGNPCMFWVPLITRRRLFVALPSQDPPDAKAERERERPHSHPNHHTNLAKLLTGSFSRRVPPKGNHKWIIDDNCLNCLLFPELKASALQDLDGLRSEAAATLLSAAQDGRLEAALHHQAGETEAGSLDSTGKRRPGAFSHKT